MIVKPEYIAIPRSRAGGVSKDEAEIAGLMVLPAMRRIVRRRRIRASSPSGF
jgi:hypothetical protein